MSITDEQISLTDRQFLCAYVLNLYETSYSVLKLNLNLNLNLNHNLNLNLSL